MVTGPGSTQIRINPILFGHAAASKLLPNRNNPRVPHAPQLRVGLGFALHTWVLGLQFHNHQYSEHTPEIVLKATTRYPQMRYRIFRIEWEHGYRNKCPLQGLDGWRFTRPAFARNNLVLSIPGLAGDSKSPDVRRPGPAISGEWHSTLATQTPSFRVSWCFLRNSTNRLSLSG